jgi:hypothetical protein
MRQIAITAVCIIISLAFTACDLNEKIYGTIDDSSFWKTEKDFREGLNYAYGTLNTPYNGFSIWQYVIEDGGADYNASVPRMAISIITPTGVALIPTALIGEYTSISGKKYPTSILRSTKFKTLLLMRGPRLAI